MSQADMLLASLTETTSMNSDSEARIIIGEDRFITVPDSLKRIAVQYDHNIETVTFECPRYWDKHDMSQMKIYINYMRPNETTGQALAKNVSVKGSKMFFDWTITRNVTQYKGKLSFLVCIKKTEADGTETNHWGSELNRDLYISEGLECTQTVVSRYPDIITQLLTRMDEVEAIATPEAMQAYTETWLEENHDRVLTEIENKGADTLASIPEDYTTAANMAEEAARKKAPAIAIEAEGESIFVDDSSETYLMGLKLYGKTEQATSTGKQLAAVNINVADYAYMGVISSATDDGNIIVSGTSNDALWNRLASADLVAGETYTLSSNGALVITIWDAVASTNLDTKARNVASLTFTAVNTGYHTFVLANDAYDVFSSVRADIMLNTGSTALPWEPYSGGMIAPCPEYPQTLMSYEAVNAAVYGANLFPTREVTAVGVTGTPQKDGSILYTGTSNSNAWQAYQQCPIFTNGTYTLSIETSNKTEKGSLIQVIDEKGLIGRSWQNVEANFSCTFDAVAGGAVRWSIGVLPDEVVNTNIKLMLNTGSSALPWVPYVNVQNLSTRGTLAGIPVTSGGNYTDSNGQQWVCDEIDFERGVYVQRVGLTTFDDATWSQNSGGKYFCNKDRGVYSDEYTVLCTHMHGGVSSNGNLENVIFINANRDIRLNITLDDPSVGNVATVMADAVLCGVLATPIETALTAEEIANFKMVRTNYPGTTILNDAGAHMAIKYNTDTRIYVDSAVAKYLAENPIYSETLIDTETGKTYRLTVTDGKLTLVSA